MAIFADERTSKIGFSRFPTPKTFLGDGFEAFWSGWRRLRRVFGEPFGCLLGTLAGVRSQKIRFCVLRLRCFRLFSAKGAFLEVSRGIFGSILLTLTRGFNVLMSPLRRWLNPLTWPSIANCGLHSQGMSNENTELVL